MRFLLILFFPRLSKASSLNFILCALCPSPLSILLAAFWTLYHLSMSLLYQGTPNWTHYFMQCLLSVKGRRIVTFFDLLALLFLIHSSMQMDLCCHRAHYWLVQCVVHQDCQLLSWWPTTKPADSSLFCCMGLIQPRYRTCIFLCWTSRGSSWPISPACQGPEWQLCPPAYWPPSPIWYHLQICWECFIDYCPSN